MNLKKSFTALLISVLSCSVFAQSFTKKKTVDYLTVYLIEEKKQIQITNPKATAWVIDEDSPDYKKDSSPSEKHPQKTITCTEITVVSGEIRKLREIYDSIKSVDDFNNLNKKWKFSITGMLNTDKETGKTTAWKFFHLMDDIEWDD